jgi:hypothetical protein
MLKIRLDPILGSISTSVTSEYIQVSFVNYLADLAHPSFDMT